MATTVRSVYDEVMVTLFEDLFASPLDFTRNDRNLREVIPASLRSGDERIQVQGIAHVGRQLAEECTRRLRRELRFHKAPGLEKWIDIDGEYHQVRTRRAHFKDTAKFGFIASARLALHAYYSNEIVRRAFRGPVDCVVSLLGNRQFVEHVVEKTGGTAFAVLTDSFADLGAFLGRPRGGKRERWREVLGVSDDDPVVEAAMGRHGIVYRQSPGFAAGLKRCLDHSRENPKTRNGVKITSSGCPVGVSDVERAAEEIVKGGDPISGMAMGARLMGAAVCQGQHEQIVPVTDRRCAPAMGAQ